MTTEDVPMKTYEIVMNDGRHQRITIPAAWKVSFGAIVPSSKGASTGYEGWGLRVWEATEKQRAVYSKVVEFWDVSIPVQVRAVRLFGTETWMVDNGSFTGEKATLVERAWMNEDELSPLPPEEASDDLMVSPLRRKRSF